MCILVSLTFYKHVDRLIVVNRKIYITSIFMILTSINYFNTDATIYF